MKTLQHRFGMVATLLVVVALTASACGSSGKKTSSSSTTAAPGKYPAVSAPGVTDAEIRFASFGTNSNNPLGTCVLKCFDEGVQAYFAYRNSQGGIFGRKLTLTRELDDQLGQNQQRALELVSANDAFALFGGTLLPSGWAAIAKANIPMGIWNIDPASAHESLFGLNPVSCGTCTRRMYAWVAAEARATKIAALGYGISTTSKACAHGIGDSIKRYGGDVGASMAYMNDHLDFGLNNGVGPEVTAMKKAGVDLVITCIDLNGDKTIKTEMLRQGLDVPMYHPDLYDLAFVKAANHVFEGDYVSMGFRPFEATATVGQTLFRKWMAKQGVQQPSEIAVHGWVAADMLYRGIGEAGPNFDRSKVIDALNKITRYTANGIMHPMDFGRQHEPPTEGDLASHGPNPDCDPVEKIQRDAFVMVTPKDKPFVCWPSETRAWSKPTFETFK